ncbi:hypothetical protein IEQ34_013297 [Dendrobium chrysotoxum]|uniref:Uncharacterized protein n=1 Tax=Dendrobium chrysotoxum TaxID=161865 RepID=A0AAV7GQZ9_DENCH|nr:hypothetical protein IEQ34_013297 [Dendrobium chrysotoxum]
MIGKICLDILDKLAEMVYDRSALKRPTYIDGHPLKHLELCFSWLWVCSSKEKYKELLDATKLLVYFVVCVINLF